MDTPHLDLTDFTTAITNMLNEKAQQYGERGGFYETNSASNYTHAAGEAKLKLAQFLKTGQLRDLVKAATWIYLIYETEVSHGPK